MFMIYVKVAGTAPAPRLEISPEAAKIVPGQYRPGNAQLPWRSHAVAGNSPEALTVTFFDGAPLWEPTASTLVTTSIPSITLPKTTWRPSSHAVFTVVRKNWEPLVPGPAFAIERTPGPVCFSLKFSSS